MSDFIGNYISRGETVLEVRSSHGLRRFRASASEDFEQYVFYLWVECVPFKVDRKVWD